MTPAMASEPYCAAAPSRSTSIRSIADDRDRVEVDAGGAAADAAVQMDERALMAPLAVDQHQHLIGSEAAQRRRAHRVGAIRDRRAREIERRRQRLDHLRRLRVAARGDLLGVMMSTGTAFSDLGAGEREPTVTCSSNPRLIATSNVVGARPVVNVVGLWGQPERFHSELHPSERASAAGTSIEYRP